MAAYSTQTSNLGVYCPDCRKYIYWQLGYTSNQAIAQHKEQDECKAEETQPRGPHSGAPPGTYDGPAGTIGPHGEY